MGSPALHLVAYPGAARTKLKGRSPSMKNPERIGFTWVSRTPGEGIDAIVGVGGLAKEASLGDVSDRHIVVVAENPLRGRRRDRTRPPANTADSGSGPPDLAARGGGILEGAPYPSKTLEVTKGRSPRRRPRPLANWVPPAALIFDGEGTR